MFSFRDTCYELSGVTVFLEEKALSHVQLKHKWRSAVYLLSKYVLHALRILRPAL